MSDITFKTYSNLEISESLSESSHVLIEENGDVKRYPAGSIGSGCGSGSGNSELSIKFIVKDYGIKEQTIECDTTWDYLEAAIYNYQVINAYLLYRHDYSFIQIECDYLTHMSEDDDCIMFVCHDLQLRKKYCILYYSDETFELEEYDEEDNI